MEFQKISFDKSCPEISWQYLALFNNKTIEVLRIKFSGRYVSSTDQSYARLIGIAIRSGIEFWNPITVLIDYSDLEFNGGDEFERTYDSVESDYTRTAVLVGPLCRKAMNKLAWEEEDKDIVDNSFFFDDADKAIAKLTQGVLK